MKHPLFIVILLVLIGLYSSAQAQKNRSRILSKSKVVKPEAPGNPAVVIDRRLAVLRDRPSLYSKPVRRMGVGRKVSVVGRMEADGVTFYRLRVSTATVGWMQSEALIGNFKRNDDQRLLKLIQAADNFDKIKKTIIFLEMFPKSPLRPPILLQMGDLMEGEAIKLSKKAARKLDRREMAASGAPLHSFYLNFPSLDRYGKLGVRFLFNLNTRSYHYDGNSWFEIIRRFPKSSEAAEAQKRLDGLKKAMEAKK